MKRHFRKMIDTLFRTGEWEKAEQSAGKGKAHHSPVKSKTKETGRVAKQRPARRGAGRHGAKRISRINKVAR